MTKHYKTWQTGNKTSKGSEIQRVNTRDTTFILSEGRGSRINYKRSKTQKILVRSFGDNSQFSDKDFSTLIGGFRGPIFMQLLGRFGQIIGWYSLGVCAPHLRNLPEPKHVNQVCIHLVARRLDVPFDLCRDTNRLGRFNHSIEFFLKCTMLATLYFCLTSNHNKLEGIANLINVVINLNISNVHQIEIDFSGN